MIKALQSSARAMAIQQQRHELIANNLANVNTPGFKRLVARVSQLSPDPAAPNAAAGKDPAPRLTLESLTQSGNGPLQATGNPLDVALVGEGYFLIDTPQGERLSRDGSFSLNAEGELVHASGNTVLAGGSAVTLREEPSILPDGSILDGDRLVGRLSLVRPLNGSELLREGDNLLRAVDGHEEIGSESVKVVSGHVEGSTVEAVSEMVEMIRAFRAYEVAQRAAQAADDTLRIAVQRVGVLRA